MRIFRNLGKLDMDSLESSISDLNTEAAAVDDRADTVNKNVDSQYTKLQGYAEEARTLSKNVEDARRDTKLAIESGMELNMKYHQFEWGFGIILEIYLNY